MPQTTVVVQCHEAVKDTPKTIGVAMPRPNAAVWASGAETAESPVLAWVRGTALRPLLAPLAPGEQTEFAVRYDAKLRRAYERRANGKTLFPFRRLFLVARG